MAIYKNGVYVWKMNFHSELLKLKFRLLLQIEKISKFQCRIGDSNFSYTNITFSRLKLLDLLFFKLLCTHTEIHRDTQTTGHVYSTIIILNNI